MHEEERSFRWLLTLALATLVVLVAGVGAALTRSTDRDAAPADAAVSPAAASPQPDTSVAVPEGAPDVEVVSCETRPEEFALLCEVYFRLVESYVDPVDDAVLAAAAARGLQAGAARLAADSGGGAAPDEVRCAAPVRAFVAMCRAYAGALARHGAVPLADLVEAAVVDMLEEGVADPRTAYVPPEHNELLQEDLSGKVEGIGAIVEVRDIDNPGDPAACQRLSRRCRLVVVAPVPGGPSEAAGIRAGDIILAFGERDVRGMSLYEAVVEGRGPAGSEVTVTLLRDGETFTAEVTRAEFVVPQAEGRVVGDGVGYVQLFGFGVNSAEQFHGALAGLLQEDVRDLVIDLRDNPGGFLDATQTIAGEFVDGDVVLLEESSGGTREYEADGAGLARDPAIDVAILVNEGSASAAEVFAAALRDAGRAVLVGEPTFGKGTVQGAWELANGGSLRVTVSRWLTPDGDSIEGGGLQPDIEVVDEDPDDDEDVVLERAVAYLRTGN